MTEPQWLLSTDSSEMLNCLRSLGRFSDRRLRLFAASLILLPSQRMKTK